MALDNSNDRIQLEEKYQHQLKDILLGNKEINIKVDEINKILDRFDKRLVILEKQQE